MPLRCCQAIPSDRRDRVPGNTSAFAVHLAKRELRLSETLLRGQAIPPCPFHIILRHAVTLRVDLT